MRWRPRLSFPTTVMLLFSIVFTVAAGLIAWGYRATGERAAMAAGEQALVSAAGAAGAHARALFEPILAFASVLPGHAPLGEHPGIVPDLAGPLQLLALHPVLASMAAIDGEGRLRRLVRLEGGAVKGMPPPPASARFVHAEVADAAIGQGIASWTFLDARHDHVGTSDVPWTGEDVVRAPWILQARNAMGVQVTPLHQLDWADAPGISVSRRTPGGGALGFDLPLAGLTRALTRSGGEAGLRVFVFFADGVLLAHSDPQVARPGGAWTTMARAPDPLLHAVWRAYSAAMLRPGDPLRLDGVEIGSAGGSHLVYLSPLPDMLGQPLLVGVAAPLDAFTGPMLEALRKGSLYALGGFLLGLLAIGYAAHRIAEPLARLTVEAEGIRGFLLDGPVPVQSRIVEIERLAGAMGAMKASLRTFGAYVPRDLVRQLIAEGGTATLGGQRRALSVMFSDVEGFTRLAEGMDPEQLMRIASAYFDQLTRVLQHEGATIDKYIGDAVMALWNAPRRDSQHVRHACRAVLAARAAAQALEADFAARGWPKLPTRFGLHTGEAVVGNVGSSDRMSYTAIGAMVNLASRLEGLNRHYGTRILVSGPVRDAAQPVFVFRSVDLVTVKGANEPVEVCELLGLSQSMKAADDFLLAPAGIRALLPAWETMMAHWRAGRLDEAREALAETALRPDDPLAALYARRLRDPAPGSDGHFSPVVRIETK